MAANVSPRERAEILLEALPYLRTFRGALFLIKFGGSSMEEPEQVARFLTDVAFLHAVGVRVILVHGGGKAINARMKERGLVPRFVGGLRLALWRPELRPTPRAPCSLRVKGSWTSSTTS